MSKPENTAAARGDELTSEQLELARNFSPAIARSLAGIKRGIDSQTTETTPRGAEIVQLPLWSEPRRGMPNPILRSALFAAIHSKDRRALNDEVIAGCEGIEIRFSGWQLNQEDFEVCSLLFHLARLHPLGDTCHAAAHAMLKELGRDTSGREHQDLHQSIRRLGQQIEIKIGRYRYFGAFVMRGVKDDITRHYNLTINPDLAGLFTQGWTAFEWEHRQTLRGKHLALWLHAYYASHAAPVPVKVETLRDWCGSRTKQLYKFRQNLRTALNQLQAAKTITGWQIDPQTDLVSIDRGTAITASQRRHLTHRKATKRQN